MREVSLMKDVNENGCWGFPKVKYCTQDKNNYYIVMDYLGKSFKELREWIQNRKFSLKTVTMLGIQMISRLKDIHRYGYVHRDLKPGNTLIGRSSSTGHVVYLIDFGLAKKENVVKNRPQTKPGE